MKLRIGAVQIRRSERCFCPLGCIFQNTSRFVGLYGSSFIYRGHKGIVDDHIDGFIVQVCHWLTHLLTLVSSQHMLNSVNASLRLDF